MRFFCACQTDKGAVRAVNQDSLIVKTMGKGSDTALLAAVCDGVGGLERGERTSRRAAELLGEWVQYELCQLLKEDRTGSLLARRFRQELLDINREIYYSNARNGISSGTTMTALLLWDHRYLIGHVGDSRAYAITWTARQLTSDHSFAAFEMSAGRMTKEEASRAENQNVILRCIGAEEEMEPELFEGAISENTVFLLCTDGLWHHVGDEEWVQYFSPETIGHDGARLGQSLGELVGLVRRRGESDNITGVAVLVF